ncbi:hypothetical protein O181_056119 [Austropuccinia psidii MF-1]|uniref:Reverse transcriptase Ty1/copia-type domain-containing protein n=1 Tax=Austropuccinia psidii MF-1 TaxID=1389203 RepID=A0A9Q3E7V3_9BASI|nr:hypothetical protein [Austropuccinia psidii MF-1]
MEPPAQPGILIGYDNKNTSYCIHYSSYLEQRYTDGSHRDLQTNSANARNRRKNHEDLPAQHSQIKVIGPWNPTLINSAVDDITILTYKRRTNALLTTVNKAPETYSKEVKSKDNSIWKQAINSELTNMAALRVWDVVDLQDDYKIAGTTWVFKINNDELNEPIEYKARLCTQGFTQSLGIDFDKTYAPAGRLSSLRTLIFFACINNLQFHTINFKCAFLNAPLKETVYLAIPQGLNLKKQKYCLRLNKAIYGLWQAPLAWYKRLKSWLTKVIHEAQS